MKMLTVFIPEKYLEFLDMLVMEERFPNRSEAIRIGIRDLIRNELILKKIIDKEKQNKIYDLPLNETTQIMEIEKEDVKP
jgi:Arc/MetJ-type ribon-helix-helix transcriptional regulator